MNMNRLNGLTNKKAVGAAALVYGGFVAYSFFKGAWSGWDKYSRWLSTREKIKTKYDLYDPVINTCIDTGHWTFYTMQGGVGSALIGATAPISVPLLSHLTKKTNEDNNLQANVKTD